MATVLEAILPKSYVLLCVLWARGLNAQDINKEIFPVYSRKCLSCKAVHNWVKKRGKRFVDEEEVETEVQKWLRQQPKYFYACGFRRTGKAMGQVYQCWRRICRGINVCFARFEYHNFLVLYPFVT
jgi:hypothetical protein